MTEGIYTLANDVVYDQLVALLNSFEVNVGKEIPVCVIPYDDRIDKVRAEIKKRKNVTLFEDVSAIAYWENFVTQAWSAHPEAFASWAAKGALGVYRLGMHRKLCALSGPFDKYVYFDADTLSMKPLDAVYEALDKYDWVANDRQYMSDIKYVFSHPEKIAMQNKSEDNFKSKIFCYGWCASKKNVFQPHHIEKILKELREGEAEALPLWWPDQSLVNYAVIRSGIPFYNFAYHDAENTPGNHHSSQFEEKDSVLYDKGRRITYLHYMGIPASVFTRVCRGENVLFPYRDVFLHYRYLHEPEKRPVFKGPGKAWHQKPSLMERISARIGKLISK